MKAVNNSSRDVFRKPVLFFGNRFSNLHKHYQMSDKINSHICLMLSVYKCFHQVVKYGHQILQDLTGFEI